MIWMIVCTVFVLVLGGILWFSPIKNILGFLCLLGLVFGISYSYTKDAHRIPKTIEKTILQKTSRSCAVNMNRMKLKRDRYALHRRSGANLSKMKLVASTTKRNALIKKGVLLPIKKMDGYIVEPMNYGSPFVHKKMHAILIEMKQRFAKKQKENNIANVHMVISSAYRTTADQKRLRKKNSAATHGISSHSYGASVDIPRLQGTSCHAARPLFEALLKELQKEKKIYLCPESKTIHITVR